jgi:hypothetical protein
MVFIKATCFAIKYERSSVKRNNILYNCHWMLVILRHVSTHLPRLFSLKFNKAWGWLGKCVETCRKITNIQWQFYNCIIYCCAWLNFSHILFTDVQRDGIPKRESNMFWPMCDIFRLSTCKIFQGSIHRTSEKHLRLYISIFTESNVYCLQVFLHVLCMKMTHVSQNMLL